MTLQAVIGLAVWLLLCGAVGWRQRCERLYGAGEDREI